MMFAAGVLFVLAQVRVTTPPSPLPRPNPAQQALSEMGRQNALDEADLHYLRRADGRNGDVASPREIDAAIELYARLIRASLTGLPPRWRYLRAVYFKAEFTGLDARQKADLYERAMPVADDAVRLARAVAGRRSGKRGEALEPAELGKAIRGDVDAEECFYWDGVVHGQWALVHGKIAAARRGVASRIRDDEEAVIAADPKLEEAGGERVLGRLHAESPRIPFVTGWVDHDAAIAHLRRAVEIAPRNFYNRLFLAEALHPRGAAHDQEARRLLAALVADTPSPDHLVEDLAAQGQARRDLRAWRAGE